VAELASYFACEHEVHIFANRVEGERDPRIRYHYIPALRFNALASILTFILPATFRFLSGFDIVHAQGLCGLRQNVTTAHMCQPAWYSAQEKYVGYLTRRQRIFRSLVEPLERHIFQTRRSAAVIAVSKRVQGDLARYYGRVDNVTVIYHGVDLRTFHPDNRSRWRVTQRAELGIANDAFVALYAGDMQKGAMPAIKAVSRVEGAHLVFISGTHPGVYKDLADELGASSRVHFCGTTSWIEKFYSAADVFILPTFYDTFGMVISEAMAAGLPVIISAEAGASELIEHGSSGVIVEPAWNVDGLAQWLERFKSSPDLRASMGSQARKQIERYTWDAAAVETMRVYQQTLAGASARR
jgi:UDP-glucose:(heptosyl)LPS alpha-1,3-glucosyltransferase